MLALLLLAITCSWAVGFGEECQFPTDNPIQDLAAGETFQTQIMDHNRVYTYSDNFGSCHGCVKSVKFCYRLGNAASEELMTIDIRNAGNSKALYRVIVNPINDRASCPERYSLGHDICCIEHTLTESFTAQSPQWHYALKINNPPSSLLRHQTDTVTGEQVDHNGTPISDPVYKPLFYFIFDPSDNDCSNTTTNTPSSETPSDEDTDDNTDDSNSEDDDSERTGVTDLTTTTVPTIEPTNPPSVESGAQSGGDPSNNSSVVAGVITVLLIMILLVIVVVVTVMCLKRRKKRQRKVVVSRMGEETGGMTNMVYGAPGGEKMEVSVATNAANSNTYCGQTKSDTMKHHYECIEDLPSKIDDDDPTPYIYASTDTFPQGQVPDASYAAIGAEINAGKRPSLHYEVDSIYEAPANSETGLYAQFEKIKVSTIPRNAIEATECLGSGQFGTVNRGVWQSPCSTLEVAIKTLKASAKEEDRIKFLQEGAIMGQFDHNNVVKLHGIVREQQTVLLVIELLAKEDLREHLLSLRPEEGKSVDSNLPHTLLSYCRQIISGLSYLAKKGFVHRDIAARNVLLSEDHETCKIADFGMSRDLADETYYISRGGKIPVKWTAPEALHYKKYSTASDVWSFGCLMYEIWSLGHKPFEGTTNVEAIKMVDRGYRLAPPPGCPRAIYQLMIKSWNPKASERPAADSLSQSLARSDPVLLKWDVSDKPAGIPQALQLGGPLDYTALLYSDLQRAYLPPDLTNNDYDEPS